MDISDTKPKAGNFARGQTINQLEIVFTLVSAQV
jgi:hypothetical protein